MGSLGQHMIPCCSVPAQDRIHVGRQSTLFQVRFPASRDRRPSTVYHEIHRHRHGPAAARNEPPSHSVVVDMRMMPRELQEQSL